MEWLGGSNKIYPFEMFSKSHFVVLGLFILISAFIFLYRKKMKGNEWKIIEYMIAIFMLSSEIIYHAWMIVNGIWNASRSLPLEMCNIALILSVILLLTRNKFIFEILFFMSLFGATQAILTPGLTYGFPHFRFFHFFFAHMMVVWVILYFTWAKGYSPTFSSVIKLMIFINLLLPVILVVNHRFHGNYWFLRHKPEGPSFFDVLGPYPWYIFTLESFFILISFIAWLWRYCDTSKLFGRLFKILTRICCLLRGPLFLLLRIRDKEKQKLENRS